MRRSSLDRDLHPLPTRLTSLATKTQGAQVDGKTLLTALPDRKLAIARIACAGRHVDLTFGRPCRRARCQEARQGDVRLSLGPEGDFIRLRHLLVILCISLIFLSGCGGHPKGVLTPIADTSSPGLSQVNLLVATTRSRSNVPGEMFSGERALKPAFAEMTISIPPDSAREVGNVAWPTRLPPNPSRDFATLKAKEIDVDAAKSWLSASVRKTPDGSVLVFIHGFNTRFEDSVYRFAQIVHDSRVHSAPILVTWPSRGSLLAYGYDRESTNYTRNALETLFQYLARDKEVKEVSILAHSMGNWLTLESLRQMAIRNGRLPAKFKNVILAAPDVDVDVFSQQIVDMGKQHPQFTLFVSRDDRALAVSRRVWGDVSRLGAIDPEQSPYKEELEIRSA